MSKIFRRSSCQKASAGTEGTRQWRYKTRILSTHKNWLAFKGHRTAQTAILKVSRLVADLKPGVSDAPLRGYGA